MRNRNNTKQLLLIFIFIFCGINSFSQKKDIDFKRINSYVEYLDSSKLSAKDYVLTQ